MPGEPPVPDFFADFPEERPQRRRQPPGRAAPDVSDELLQGRDPQAAVLRVLPCRGELAPQQFLGGGRGGRLRGLIGFKSVDDRIAVADDLDQPFDLGSSFDLGSPGGPLESSDTLPGG